MFYLYLLTLDVIWMGQNEHQHVLNHEHVKKLVTKIEMTLGNCQAVLGLHQAPFYSKSALRQCTKYCLWLSLSTLSPCLMLWTNPHLSRSASPRLPVDAPNKATCVVSGRLQERSVRRPCLPCLCFFLSHSFTRTFRRFVTPCHLTQPFLLLTN